MGVACVICPSVMAVAGVSSLLLLEYCGAPGIVCSKLIGKSCVGRSLFDYDSRERGLVLGGTAVFWFVVL